MYIRDFLFQDIKHEEERGIPLKGTRCDALEHSHYRQIRITIHLTHSSFSTLADSYNQSSL